MVIVYAYSDINSQNASKYMLLQKFINNVPSD